MVHCKDYFQHRIIQSIAFVHSVQLSNMHQITIEKILVTHSYCMHNLKVYQIFNIMAMGAQY